MKFLVIVSDFPKITETFVLRNARHFLDKGHDVTMFHLKPFRADEVVHEDFADVMDRALGLGWLPAQALPMMARTPGRLLRIIAQIVVAFARKPRHLAVSLSLIPKAAALARRCRSDGIDHIHAEFAGYPATVAWIASLLSGIPFSFSAHAHDIFITQGLLARKADDAQFVRAISQFNKRFLEGQPNFPQGKVEVLHCGVSVPAQPPDMPPEKPFQIVFVGALLPRKGVDVLLEAVARLPEGVDWRLDILGGGSLEEDLRIRAASLPAGRITFHGPQPISAVRAAMTRAHVIAVPSREGEAGRSEGIPVVLMEAMSLGRAVVASRLSGIPELVIDADTGLLVAPNDPAELADALLRLASDPQLATRLGLAGRARVADEFDIEKTAQQLLDRMIETTP